MKTVPTPLTRYMQGLRAHDIDLIGSTFSDETRFVTPVRTMQKAEILAFLQALYTGFPNWSYENDAPELAGGSCWRVNWLQGGTHTEALALPGFPAVPATGRKVQIPKHFFYYEVTSDVLLEIRPDPILGGAPRGIFEQIGVKIPPL
ncbi:MAG: nuclear transport factor 2 family protein [Geminicoccaceae bacterium]